MPNELKATLSIILVSCMISTLYEYVEAAMAVAHSKSHAVFCHCTCEHWVIVTETEEILTVSVAAIKRKAIMMENKEWSRVDPKTRYSFYHAEEKERGKSQV